VKTARFEQKTLEQSKK